MKKITLIIYLIFGSYLAIYAQNERNLKTATLAWDTTYIVDSISDIVMGNDGIGYSDNNSILFEMDINSFLKKADSIFIGYDSFPDEGVFKEATIYSVSSRIKEMYLWSMAFQKSNDMLYVEYISYLDDKGFVHEFFNTPENQVVLKKFIDLFTTPEKYPNARILDGKHLLIYYSEPSSNRRFFLRLAIIGKIRTNLSNFISIDTMQKLLGVDMDECLSETLDATLKYNNYIFNNLPIHREDVSNFFIHRIPKFYASEEYSSEWYNHYLMSDEVKNLQPVSGAMDKLSELKKEGYSFFVVTGRSDKLKKSSWEWIISHYPGIFDDILLANDLTEFAVTKSFLCKNVGIEIMIEDNLDYAIELASAGIKVYLIDKPWNQNYNPDIHKNIIKVDGWENVHL